MSRLVRCLTLGLTAVLLSSCSQSDLPDLQPVRGKVTLDGTPVQEAQVMFAPIHEQSRPSIAVTNSGGEFELRFNSDNSGAPEGRFHVTVSKVIYKTTNPNDPGTETLPRKYQQEGTLDVDIIAGENLIDLALTSK